MTESDETREFIDMKTLPLWTFALLALGLTGCGGGGGSAADFSSCVTISGGATQTAFSSSGCVGCSTADQAAAIDNNFDTAARINFPANSTGSASLQATAQSGITYAGGNIAAVALGQGPVGSRITVSTYMGAALQDDGTLSTSFVDRNGAAIAYIRTTRPFNAVRYTITSRGGGTETVGIREFCSNART